MAVRRFAERRSVPDRRGVAAGFLGFNLAVLLIAFGAGWFESSGIAVRTAPPEAAVWTDRGEVWRDAGYIAAHNVQALFGLVVFGVCSGGIYGWAVIGSNGYGFGRLLSAVAVEEPVLIPLVLSYAPVEFAAMVLASAVAQGLFMAAWRWLTCRHPGPFLWPVGPIGLTLVLITVASILEADAQRRMEVMLR